MHKYISYIKYLLLISCLIFFPAGCSSKKPKPDRSHAALLERGLYELNRGNTMQARGILQIVKDRYPYTDSAVVASLKLADIHYKLGDYTTAYDLFDEFEKYHPKDKNIPYIKYQKAMCYFIQIKNFDRDQSYVQHAKEEFEKLIDLFPDNEYTVMARRQLRECLLKQARFEIYTGNFYFKQKRYLSALQRYKYAIKNLPDVGQYHEALEKISACQVKLAESRRRVPPSNN